MENRLKIEAAAYGGRNWKPRLSTHKEEIGNIWSKCGINSEWKTLKRVLLHPPGEEFRTQLKPDDYQMLDSINFELAQNQHMSMIKAYKEAGILVDFVNPRGMASPNLIFCADLFFMTPEGAILSRPASRVRAGEEIWVARRLADLEIPILRTLHGSAVFEGADAIWLTESHVIIGKGLRTNKEAIIQISNLLNELSIQVTVIDLPIGSMHLMGILRFLDKDLVMIWPYRLAWRAVEELKEAGYEVLFIPNEAEATQSGALNFVTLGPRKILMSEGNPITQSFLETYGVQCRTICITELLKAAGGIGCMTGIIERELE
jgi:N-dimethylarginine dimethylaminohydrolase